jgi:hypothetical protein
MRFMVASLSRAIQVCLVHPGPLGIIHSVFDRAVNIRLVDSTRIIAMTFTSAGGLPYALMLSDNGSLSFLSSGIVAGQEIELQTGSLLKINGIEDTYDFSHAAIWDPGMDKLADPENCQAFSELLAWAAGYVHQRANQAGLVPLLKDPQNLFSGTLTADNNPDMRLARLAAPNITGILKALLVEDIAALNPAITRLIGYGIGGTPSGDDLLVGLLAALTRSSQPRAERMRRLLSTCLNGQLDEHATSLLSLTVLRHALVGEFSEKVHTVTRMLMLPDDIEALESSLSRLLLHGATSGSEMFLGICLGFMLLQKT